MREQNLSYGEVRRQLNVNFIISLCLAFFRDSRSFIAEHLENILKINFLLFQKKIVKTAKISITAIDRITQVILIT